MTSKGPGENLDLFASKPTPEEAVQKIEIYSDGSCLGNPGPGGWGAIMRTDSGEEELSGGKDRTTNNEMELTAALEPLKKLKKPSRILMVTDSEYLVKGMTQWIHNWKRKGWKTAAKKPVKNRALWEDLDRYSAPHQVEWVWIRGHAGHPENERCDRLAREEATRYKRA